MKCYTAVLIFFYLGTKFTTFSNHHTCWQYQTARRLKLSVTWYVLPAGMFGRRLKATTAK